MSLMEYMSVVETLEGLSRVTGVAEPRDDWEVYLRRQLKEGGNGQLPIGEQVFPGDSVAIAVSGLVPRGDEIALAIIKELQQSGIDMRSVSIVGVEDWQQAIEGREEHWGIHDPTETEGSSMVGVSRNGEAIYLNSRIADADVVIPVVPAGLGSSTDGYLYPAFSTRETQLRLAHQMKLGVEEALEAEQMVSPFFVVGVVSAPSQQVGEILVSPRGASDSVGSQIRQSFWSTNSQQYDAVVATLGPAERHAGLEYVLDSLRVASQLVVPHGPIVIFGKVETDWERDAIEHDQEEEVEGDLSAEQQDDEDDEGEGWDEDEADYRDAVELGDAMRDESESQADSEDEWSEPSSDSEVDWEDDEALGENDFSQIPVRQQLDGLLEELRSRQPVFLISQLDADQTEELGFGYLSDVQDLQRLLSGYENVGLLEEAFRWKVVAT